MRSEEEILEGRNAVIEALRSERIIERVFVQKDLKDGPILTILREAGKHPDILISRVEKSRLDQLSVTGMHQGVIAYAAAAAYAGVEDILTLAEKNGEDPFLFLLDEIVDPHNLGAIIRTAHVLGAHGVIIPKRRSAALTAAAVRASAGAVSYVPVAKVTNLVQTIEKLKKRGIWIACADMDGDVMYKKDLTGPIGLVIGSEGNGVSRLVKEACDFTVSIPMKGEIGSLNASVAAAVLGYEIFRQRMEK